MIRKERLALDTATFAAERKDNLKRAEERFNSPVRTSLMRRGLPNWDDAIAEAALKLFDDVVREETSERSQVIDDMRDAYEVELRRALEKTKAPGDPEKQVATMKRWLSTMTVNAATEAATTADPDESVGLEWVTMGDDNVRETHVDANGQTVPTGQAFNVGGEEFLYPGQPVGDPSLWINCRCVVRPTMLSGFAAKGETFAIDDSRNSETEEKSVEEKKITTTVIVALPAADDPINSISSEEDGAHVTLLFLGESDEFDPEPIKAVVASIAAEGSGPDPFFEEAVASKESFHFGNSDAEVILMDASHLATIRGAILGTDEVRARHDQVEQFPTWLPHLTLGYPETPKLSEDMVESVRFDRLALWHGEEKFEFPIGEAVPEDAKVIHAEDPEFTQEMADTFAAQVDAGEYEAPAEEEVDDAPMIPDDEATEQVPWHGVLAPEGTPSGDGRQFANEALTHRSLPLPLKAMFIDDEGHKGSSIVGRIDRIFRENGLIKAEGVFDTSDTAYEAVRLLAEGMWRGVSVDVDAVAATAMDESEEEMDLLEFASARIASATMCAIPAFAEAFLALGPWEDGSAGEDVATDEETPGGEVENIGAVEYGAGSTEFDIAPRKTKDGPGWVTEPKPTQRITGYWVDGRGAAKIGWGAPGDFNRCRVQLAKYVQNPKWLAGLCANLHYRALGAWPGQANAGTESMTASAGEPTFLDGSLTASVTMTDTRKRLSADYFKNPMLTDYTPMTITEPDEHGVRHVFGHLASWDVCHIGIANACVNAPHTKVDFAYFATGKVLTDAGMVPVGQITMGPGGHAPDGISMTAALSHYDNLNTSVADVSVYEDGVGIAVAGIIRDDVSEKDVYKLRASGVISGDWREVIVKGESHLELCAALAVNVPGFPIPRPSLAASGGEQTSLVAASIVQGDKPSVEDDVDRQARIAKANAAKAKVRAYKVQQAKNVFASASK